MPSSFSSSIIVIESMSSLVISSNVVLCDKRKVVLVTQDMMELRVIFYDEDQKDIYIFHTNKRLRVSRVPIF